MSTPNPDAGKSPAPHPENTDIAPGTAGEAFERNYSETGFRDKLNRFAKEAGRELVEKALWLYYAAQQPETPAWAKATIFTALGYFILPTDAIPDITPVVGFGDDLGAITLALATIAAYVTPAVKEKTAARLRQWFGEDAS